MTADQATTIINMAIESGFYGETLPPTDEERISEASQIVTEAQEAYEQGARGDAVKTILFFAPTPEEESMEEEVKADVTIDVPAPLELQPEIETETDNVVNFPKPALAETPKLGTIHEAKEKALAKIKKERLPIPDEIEGSPPILPKDISKLSDSDLRSLHSQFNACLARTNWLLALEEADELSTRHLVDYHEAKYVKEHSGEINESTKKPKAIGTLEAEALLDEDVKDWQEKHQNHVIEVKLLKSLRDIYQSNCDRASRDWTMRDLERQSK